MNDITDSTIDKLKTLCNSPELADPDAFTAEVLNRIRPSGRRSGWFPSIRVFAYAVSLSIILLFIGMECVDNDNVADENRRYCIQRIPPHTKDNEQKIESMSSAIKLVEEYKKLQK